MEDGLGDPAADIEGSKLDGDGVPVRESQDGLDRSHTTDRRRERWGLGRRAWVGVDGNMVRVGRRARCWFWEDPGGQSDIYPDLSKVRSRTGSTGQMVINREKKR